MTDPDVKYRHSKRRKRNFIAKKLLQDKQFRRKIHVDEKSKQKEEKWMYNEQFYSEDDD